MKAIIRLYTLDWRRIFKSIPATLLLLALVIIPSLYCWFNVWALWDPYANTQSLKVAVYSADQPAKVMDKQVAIGDQLITQLRSNNKLGWQFADSKQAVREGVKIGKYYAGIVVPKSFSKDLTSFINGTITKPQLDYYVNEKINAIAPKITATGAATLQTTIADEFTNTVAKTVVTTMNKAGIELDKNVPVINRFSDLILSTNKQLPTIEGYLDQVQSLRGDLPKLKQKLAVANDLAKQLPMVDAMAQKLVGAQAYLPMVEEAGALAGKVNQKVPEIKAAGNQLNTVVTHFGDLESGLTKTLAVTDKSLNALTKVDQALPNLQQFGEDSQQVVTTTKAELLPQVQTAFDTVHTGIDAGLTLLINANHTAAADMATLNNQLAALQTSPTVQTVKTEMAAELTRLSERQAKAATVAASMAKVLTQLQAAHQRLTGDDSTRLAGAIDHLNRLALLATTFSNQAKALASDIPSLSTGEIQKRLGTLQQTANQFGDLANQLQSLNLATSVSQVLTELDTALGAASTTLSDINLDILPALPGLSKDMQTLLKQAQAALLTVQNQLPQVKQELTDANQLLNGNMDLITNGINTVTDLYQNDYPALKEKLAVASAFIQQDLPGIEQDATTALALANDKLPVLEAGLNDADKLIKTDWPTLKQGIIKGAAAITKAKKTVNLSDLMALLRKDAGKEASFLANPVKLNQEALYPIPTYGSQSAPFYLALCIWVGALLLGAIVMTEHHHLPDELAATKPWQRYIARWLTFVTLGLGQAMIAALGNLYLIGTYVVEKPLYVLLSMGLSVVFVTILYTLIALLGNVGKGVGIILLVLSISGAGGNFPVILSGKFFQFINPLLPFTYAVDMLRETTGGIYWPNMWVNLLALAGFGIAFFLLGVFLKGPIRPWIEKLHAWTQKSQIIE